MNDKYDSGPEVRGDECTLGMLASWRNSSWVHLDKILLLFGNAYIHVSLPRFILHSALNTFFLPLDSVIVLCSATSRGDV